MELSEWCEQAPHGPYFQPIRLRLDGAEASDHTRLSPPASPTSLAAPSTPPPSDNANGNANGHMNGHTASSPGSTTPKRLKRREKPLPTAMQTSVPIGDADRDGFVLLPPFQSAQVGGGHTVLNVGGPVWAMDWLPHDVYRATASAATKQQKPNGRASDKENVDRNANGTAPATGKDPLAEWRLLALSTHPPCTVVDNKLVKNTPPDHHYDAPQGGRNLVQIWAVPVIKKPSPLVKTESSTEQPDEPQPSSPRMVPRLVYAIDHDSGVAWDVHWSPLTHKMARYRQAGGLLGVLAVAFGDGSVQVFEIPLISSDKLQPEPSEHVVVRLQPIACGKMERIIQLSVRWSPHRPNLLLTGCSDGSVALWNLEELVSKPAVKDGVEEVYEMEPQRRFQDADTVGKQEPFDWGWGWVAVRAVCWSPFDANLFATTGNDSLFKIWDIREPRICFRSHRIRSTWGLSIQWMDDTSLQISGDQGSLFTYDVLSGSYQKLHFHPQIDSPVWDLQFARKGRLPILLSSCTSGSLRVAPAKKIFRAPQNSVEFCRLHGEKNANVEQPHKSLTLSFDHRIVNGSAEAASPATREFCERDAALHRVRLSTNESGEFPCFLAAGGHAGLVILMEMQDEFDSLFENYFLQPSKKIGRPRKAAKKVMSPWNGRRIVQDKPKKAVAPPKVKRVGNLSSFAQFGKHTPTSKKATASDTEYPEFQVESPSEAEYQDGESESDSDEVFLAEDDNSDDDRVVGSDDEGDSDEVEILESPESPNVARMRHEYQMDLSEEDAFMLAIQMSELEQNSTPQTPATNGATEAKAVAREEKPRVAEVKTKRSPKEKGNEEQGKSQKNRKPASTTKTPASGAKPASGSKSDNAKKPAPRVSGDTNGSKRKEPKASVEASKAPAVDRRRAAQPDVMYVDDMDQSSIQMHIYQQGMTEEDALREALRMSEMGHMRRSNRKRKTPSPSPSSAFPDTPSSARRTPTPQKRTKTTAEKATTASATETPATVVMTDEVTRRLEFVSTSPPPTTELQSPPVEASQAVSPPVTTPKKRRGDAAKTPPLPPKPRATPVSSGKKKEGSNKGADGPGVAKTASADNDALSTPKQPTRRSNTEKTSTATKSSRKTTPTSSTKKPKPKAKRASGSGGVNQFLTDEELLAIALQTSQIEY